jgi:predicted permease
MDSILQDLRYAVRNLVRRPGFSALAILTLAIGVGVNALAFSAINALLFHPFMFPGVDRLGWVMLKSPGNPDGALSWPEFLELRRMTGAFDAVAAHGSLSLAMDVDGHAEQIFALVVSGQYFEAIDARAEQGRTFGDRDVSALEIPAIVSHRFWTERMGGGSIAGRTLTIGSRSVAVVGVMADSFQGPTGMYEPEIWLPLERLDTLGAAAFYRAPDHPWLGAIARLAPGVSAGEANARLEALATRLSAAAPHTSDGRQRQIAAHFYPMRNGHPEVQGLEPYARVVMAIVGVVLLIACLNVAALLLARSSERRREIGVRTALGASRWRVVRLLLIEGLMLSTLSGVAALIAARWSGRLLSVFALPAPEPQRLHMDINARLVEFIAATVIAAGVLPALLPALHATRRSIFRSMRPEAGFGDGRSSRVRNTFVIAQIAGSTLFLATALLCVRSFFVAADFKPGFDVDRTIVATLNPRQFGAGAAKTRVALDTVLARLADSPAVAAVSAADRAPFYVGYPRPEIVASPGEDCVARRCRPVATYAVLRGQFAALGIPIVAGRDFTDAEIRSGTAVIVSRALANQRWPNGSAIGQPLRIGPDSRAVHVVGVADDIRQHTVSETPAPVLYRPLADTDLIHGFTVIARASADPRAAIVAVRDAIRATVPDVPIESLETMRSRLELPLGPYHPTAGFFLICGALALVLAMVGLFGVTYFTVRQRTREFGIRIAVGARSTDVVGQVLLEGIRLSVPAAALGIVGAFVAGRLLSRLLVGVGPADPVSLAGAAAIEMIVALAACAWPARRATQADPIAALRAE